MRDFRRSLIGFVIAGFLVTVASAACSSEGVIAPTTSPTTVAETTKPTVTPAPTDPHEHLYGKYVVSKEYGVSADRRGPVYKRYPYEDFYVDIVDGSTLIYMYEGAMTKTEYEIFDAILLFSVGEEDLMFTIVGGSLENSPLQYDRLDSLPPIPSPSPHPELAEVPMDAEAFALRFYENLKGFWQPELPMEEDEPAAGYVKAYNYGVVSLQIAESGIMRIPVIPNSDQEALRILKSAIYAVDVDDDEADTLIYDLLIDELGMESKGTYECWSSNGRHFVMEYFPPMMMVLTIE